MVKSPAFFTQQITFAKNLPTLMPTARTTALPLLAWMNLLVKDAVALLLAAFGLIATTRWLFMRCYSPPQPARLARLVHAVHKAGRQQRKRDVAETATLLNATGHLRTPVGVWHALAPPPTFTGSQQR